MPPTYDQFEVEQAAAYSGSYVSDYMYSRGTIFNTGSYARRKLIDSATKTNLTGGMDGLIGITSEVYPFFLEYLYPGFYSTIGQTNLKRSHDFFSSEIVNDTMLANPLDFYVKNVQATVRWEPGCAYDDKEMVQKLNLAEFLPSSSFVLTIGAPGCTSSNLSGEQIVDTSWLFQFPYQSFFKPNNHGQKLYSPSFKSNSYYSCHTTLRVNKSDVEITGSATNQILPKIDRFSNIAIAWRSNTSPTLIGSRWFYLVDYPASITSLNPFDVAYIGTTGSPFGGASNDVNRFSSNILEAYKLFFGVGKYSIALDGLTPRKFVEPLLGFNNGQIQIIVIRGWKYGIQSAFPTTTKCVYRIGKFGQFRDMLEGRPTVASITPAGDRPTLTGRATPRTEVFPLVVSFVSGTTTYTNAMDYKTSTNPSYNPYDSGIYDIYYRSGQPFFDRDNED